VRYARRASPGRGESRFTTWAYRFVVLEVSVKLGRHYWRRHPADRADQQPRLRGQPEELT
jgi:hypothetical protein